MAQLGKAVAHRRLTHPVPARCTGDRTLLEQCVKSDQEIQVDGSNIHSTNSNMKTIDWLDVLAESNLSL